MTNPLNVKIAPEFLMQLKDQHQRRLQLEAELGVLTFQYHQMVREYEVKRERSIREQSLIGTHALREVGLDPDIAEYHINLDTGEVT